MYTEIILLILLILLIYLYPIYQIHTHINETINNKQYENINALIRQVYRWHIASTQDNNPVIALLHSNYAVGYLGALRSISTDNEIKKITNLDINLLEKEATMQQDKSIAKLAKLCPKSIPASGAYYEYVKEYLMKI